MKKQTTKSFAKEWIELTLCDMLDDVFQLMKDGKPKEEIMRKIKKFSAEIYNAQ